MRQTWLFGIVISILVLIIGVLGYFLWQEKDAVTVARVGEVFITDDEWIKNLKSLHGAEVLEEMVNKETVFQTASELGIKIPEQKIMQEVEKIKAQYSSEEEFIISVGDYIEDLKEDLRYILLLEELATKDVYIADPEVEAHYNQYVELYTDPAALHLQIIVVETREDATRVREELENGSDFGTLAQEQSIDLYSSSSGGDLGWITYDDPTVEEVVIEEAIKLEIDQISKPIQIEEGYALIRLIDRREERILPFKEVREDIRRELALIQVDSLVEVLEQLKNEKGVEIFLAPDAKGGN